MISSQYFSGALADNDAGSHGVAGGHARHDGSIGNTQVFDSIDFEVGVYDGHGITAQLGGTRLMAVGYECIPDEVVQFGPVHDNLDHLALHESAENERGT